MEWVFAAAAVVVLALGLVSYRARHRNDDRQTVAIVSLIVGADLLVLAIATSLA